MPEIKIKDTAITYFTQGQIENIKMSLDGLTSPKPNTITKHKGGTMHKGLIKKLESALASEYRYDVIKADEIIEKYFTENKFVPECDMSQTANNTTHDSCGTDEHLVDGQVTKSCFSDGAVAEGYVVGLIFTKNNGDNSTHYAHRLKFVKATDEESAIMIAMIDLWSDELKEHQLFMKPIALKLATASW